MPVRIYALAKELKLDSKQLVEICAKAGVSGKGSALASLTDDEAVKVKAYLSGGSRAGSATGAPEAPVRRRADKGVDNGGVVRREDYIAPAGVGGKMPVLTERPKPPSTGQPKTPPKPPPPSSPT